MGARHALCTALPVGGVVLYLAVNAGGFFPDSQGVAAVAVLVVLALQVGLDRRRLPAMSPWLVAGALGLAGLAGWSLASALWSDAPFRALAEFNRNLLYLGVFLAVALAVRRRSHFEGVLWGILVATAVVCGVALATRLFPDIWSIDPGVGEERLSYPVTYWNALGLVAALGALLALGATSRSSGSRIGPMLAASAVPLLATTIYFTFSRGSIVVCALGCLILALVTRTRIAVALAAVVLPTTAVLVVAYQSDMLASSEAASTSAAAAQGHRVAAVLVVAMLIAAVLRAGAAWVEARISKRPAAPLSGRARLLALVAALTMASSAVLLSGAPSWINDQFEQQADESTAESPDDFRSRLSQPDLNGRMVLWETSLRDFDDEILHGSGAGTFQLSWEAERPDATEATDAHSIYLETAGELGIIGLAFLALFMGAVFGGVWRRLRGATDDLRVLYGVAAAVIVAWAARAGLDWDWEMPAVTVPFLAIAAATLQVGHLSPTRQRRGGASVGRWARLTCAVGLLLLCAVPLKVWSSQSWLDRANEEFAVGNCHEATASAERSLQAVGFRAEPYEIIGYCAIRADEPEGGIMAFREASERDPLNWNYRYGLALATGSTGLDPRPYLEQAFRLNPQGVLTIDALDRFDTNKSGEWRSRARELASRFNSL